MPAAIVMAIAGSALAAPTEVKDEGPPVRVEGEQRLGVGGGLSVLRIEDKSTLSVGVGGGIHYGVAVSDVFDFLVEATSSIVARNETFGPKIPHTRPEGVDTLAAGLAYLVDLTRLAPYGGLLLSAASLGGGTLDHPLILPGLQLALGADYRLSRHLALGLAYRQHLFARKPDVYPVYSTTFLRVEYVWGP